MSDAQALAARAIAAAEGRAQPDEHPAYRQAREAQEVKDAATAKEYGCEAADVARARLVSMPLHEYLTWSTVSTAAEATQAETDAEKVREAHQQAQHERLVEKVKERLG